MKLHHTQYKKNYRTYILDHITDQNGNPLKTDQEKIDRLFDRFESEYGFNIDRLGYFKALQEWLQGLAIPFACYNNEIIDVDGYFQFMANIIYGLKKERSNNA
jgi:hypothetical protein